MSRQCVCNCLAIIVVGLMTATPVLAQGGGGKAKGPAPKVIEGDWVLTSTDKAGKTTPATGQTVYSLHGGKYTVKVAGKVTEMGSYQVVKSGPPIQVDFLGKNGQDKKAILAYKNGTATISFHAKTRPTSLVSKANSAHTVMNFEHLRAAPKMMTKTLAATGSSGITLNAYNDNGYITIGWNNPGSIGYWDFVALYDHDPAADGNFAYNYLSNTLLYCSHQWGDQTSYPARGNSDNNGKGYWAAYGAWNYGSSQWQLVSSAGPFFP